MKILCFFQEWERVAAPVSPLYLESRWVVLQETRVEYFRGKDFVALFRNHPEIKDILDEDKNLEAEDIGDALLKKKLIARCDRVVKTVGPTKKKLSTWPAHLEFFPVDFCLEICSPMFGLNPERKSRVQSSNQIQITKQRSIAENGKLVYKLSTASSTGSMEESFFLQASLDSSDKFLKRRNLGEPPMSSYYFKNMTPSALEAALRQKEGELGSYMSHLTTMESVRDSLAEELVKMTEQCEKWRTEATMIPVIRAELEALRRRHAAVLELIGEVMKRQFWWAWFVIGSWLKQEEMMQLAEPECVGSSLPLIHWLLNEVSTIPALKQMSGNFWKEEVTKSRWPSNPKLSLRCALGQIRWLSFGANHGDVGRKKEYRW